MKMQDGGRLKEVLPVIDRLVLENDVPGSLLVDANIDVLDVITYRAWMIPGM